jgi:hypothetical protein
MTINKIRVTHADSKKLLSVTLLIGMLLASACGSAGVVPAAAASAAGNSSATTNQSAPVIAETTAPQANQPASNAKCDALFLANYDMGMALARMVTLTADTDYTAYTSPDSPFYLDFKKLRSELDTLATLPDPSATDALIVGKPSDSVTYLRQMMDLAETDIKNQGKPFVDTSPSGVKLIGFDTPWEQHVSSFGVAMGNVCKNYTAPSNLFAGTPAAGNNATQSDQAGTGAMETLSADSTNMQATISALTTAMPPDPAGTPSP